MSAQSDEPFATGARMTGQLVAPLHPLSISEYLAIGEVEPGYTELVEGSIVMSPSPVPRHNRAQKRLLRQLDDQIPAGLEAIPELDVDLALSGPDGPGWSRRPDIVVAHRSAYDRVDRDGGVLAAAEVVLAVEILSPGSRRTDHVTKRGEYADAGIGHYWVVDLGDRAAQREPVSLLACHLAGEFGYADGGVVTGRFVATEPFAVELDLDALG
ncbi:Uma2 family endonuclease [Pseudonocardia sp. NPDC049635]|uniref:Uma2 family endonuclease n=1 Tax=Pseudonocardia sp. NPDC049635 TaxID=3155506 RepID=UPI0033C4119C